MPRKIPAATKSTGRSSGRRPKTRAQQAADTRERILQRAILLFNRKGVQSVSIEAIASDLKISPGNLNYHFPRKRDLIEASLTLLQERLRTALKRTTTLISADDGAAFLTEAFRSMWQFRFYFNGLTYIVGLDPKLRRDFYNFRDWIVDTLESDCREFSQSGYIMPEIAPNSFRLLAENVWGSWLNWLRMQQIESPLAPIPENEALYQCALHQWSMSQHWLKPVFRDELLAAFQKMLLGEVTLAR